MLSDYWLAVDKFGYIHNAVHSGDGRLIPEPSAKLEDVEWKPRQQVSAAAIVEYEQRNGF